MIKKYLSQIDAHTLTYKAGSVVKIPEDNIAIVIRGSVDGVVTDDSEFIPQTYITGDIIHIERITDAEAIKQIAMLARSDCEIATAHKDSVQRVMNDNPALTSDLLKISIDMAMRVKESYCDRVMLDAASAVGSKIEQLAKEDIAMTHPDGVQIKISRMHLATMTGIARETVGRALKHFAERELIQVKGKNIVLIQERPEYVSAE